ncbi:hypothetical protein C7M84_008123 [Penaeus vannamei]|uniref:Uncharacterized protein n=1 Tax=Penaeus vannamei TaxID=6689 RepID=A0A3R7QP00_PENVA|nr:hypothetical protein C7M84_008123 [Penaeus vannamei]
MSLSTAVLKTVQGKGCTVSKAASACISACHKHTLTGGEGKMTLEQAQQQPCQKMHQVVGSQVAATAYIPLPPNVEELQASEKCASPMVPVVVSDLVPVVVQDTTPSLDPGVISSSFLPSFLRSGVGGARRDLLLSPRSVVGLTVNCHVS